MRATEAIKKIASNPRRNILDIGCGIGQVTMDLSKFYAGAQVYGFDISERSIELAQKLFCKENIHFIQADTLMDWKLIPEIQFDLIVFVDVYEHIPQNERPGLHAFLRERLSPDGIIFLSCPTPAFLAWLKINNPTKIQPVDEDIDISVLQVLASETKTHLRYYEEQKVWRSGDYFYAALHNFPFAYKSTETPGKTGIIKKIKLKIQSKLMNAERTKQVKRKREIANKTGIQL
jgi:SAM-dependent methyltransferase